MITAITVNASRNADKKAPEKQNRIETNTLERILVTIFVNKNSNKSLHKINAGNHEY